MSPDHRGPAPSRTPSTMTLEEARGGVAAVVERLATLVPGAELQPVKPGKSGVIMDCAPGAVSFARTSWIDVPGPLDLDDLALAVEEEWADEPDWRVKVGETSTGEPRVSLRGPYAEGHLMEVVNARLKVYSFSGCFLYDADRDGYAWDISAE